jgi:hypothetical protein
MEAFLAEDTPEGRFLEALRQDDFLREAQQRLLYDIYLELTRTRGLGTKRPVRG